jgi:hypothetical protein
LVVATCCCCGCCCCRCCCNICCCNICPHIKRYKKTHRVSNTCPINPFDNKSTNQSNLNDYHIPIPDRQTTNDDIDINQNIAYPSVQYPPVEYKQHPDFNQPISENQDPDVKYPEPNYE